MKELKAKELKAFADEAIKPFYQQIFKPYLNKMLDDEYSLLLEDPSTEFDCVKRDIILYANRKLIKAILYKFDTANDKLSKIIQKNL